MQCLQVATGLASDMARSCAGEQDYHLTEDNDSQASTAPVAGSSDASPRDMGLQLLGLKPEDVVANVCLLGVMPDFRRAGVSWQSASSDFVALYGTFHQLWM